MYRVTTLATRLNVAVCATPGALWHVSATWVVWLSTICYTAPSLINVNEWASDGGWQAWGMGANMVKYKYVYNTPIVL